MKLFLINLQRKFQGYYFLESDLVQLYKNHINEIYKDISVYLLRNIFTKSNLKDSKQKNMMEKL